MFIHMEKQKSHSVNNLYVLLLHNKDHTCRITDMDLAVLCLIYIFSPEKENTLLTNFLQQIKEQLLHISQTVILIYC